MAPTFRTVFDLTVRPDLIRPTYWFITIFVFAGIVLAALAWLAVRRHWRSRYSLPIFAAVWIGVSAYVIVTDIRDTTAIRHAVEAGKTEITMGCLDYFRPGSPQGDKTTAGNERWSVNGLDFSYGAGEVRPAFHSVSTSGGAVRGDSRVRVHYVVSPAYSRREIIKLELAAHACPMARHVDTFDRP